MDACNIFIVPFLRFHIPLYICIHIYCFDFLTLRCRSQRSTHMPTLEMKCFRALKSLVTMLFRLWLFKSIPTMLALGIVIFYISSDIKHSMFLSFLNCGSGMFLLVLLWRWLLFHQFLCINLCFILNVMQVSCHKFFCS